MKDKYLVVIPARNEEKTIYEVVSRALRYADVCVTDDGSQDNTAHILKEVKAQCRRGAFPHSLHIITHPVATHIPMSIQDGLRYGLEHHYDFVITMDAGLSHDPAALPGFMKYDTAVDLTIGKRRKPSNVPVFRRMISRLGAVAVNYALSSSAFNFTGPRIGDCTSGFRRYSRKAVDLIVNTRLRSRSFDFHMEALALCVRAGMKVSEIPIHFVFSNSSFNGHVLVQAVGFCIHLIKTKRDTKQPRQTRFAESRRKT